MTRFIVSSSFALLIDLYLSPDETTTRPAIVSAMARICQALHSVRIRSNNSQKQHVGDHAIEPFKDQLIGAFTSSLTDHDSVKIALEGILSLVRLEHVLSSAELGFVVHKLNELLLSDGHEAD